MRARDREKFKKLLLQRRSKLTGTLSSMAEEALKTHGSSHGVEEIADLGSDQYEQELTLVLMESERGEVQAIDEALNRIDDGSFGKCTCCSAKIPPPRLNAIPHAPYCIECQSHLERTGVLPDHEEE